MTCSLAWRDCIVQSCQSWVYTGCSITGPVRSRGECQVKGKAIKPWATNELILSQRGQTALLRAAASGRADLARLLISHGADVDIQDNEGFSALITAARFNHKEVVRLLIDAGAMLHLQTTVDDVDY